MGGATVGEVPTVTVALGGARSDAKAGAGAAAAAGAGAGAAAALLADLRAGEARMDALLASLEALETGLAQRAMQQQQPAAGAAASVAAAPQAVAAGAAPAAVQAAPAAGHADGALPAALSSKKPRELSLRQLRDLVEDAYASKERHDGVRREMGQPVETMAQHLYTLLTQKYGLRSLITEWLNSINAAIERFRAEHNDIAVFAAILAGEVDEEFRHVQDQLEVTVKELVRLAVKNKYGPSKTDREVSALAAKKMTGALTEEECADMVTYMYDEADAEYIVRLLEARLRPAAGRGAGGKRSIETIQFLHLLLEFQFDGHRRFLMPLATLFAAVDTDSDGLIDGAQLKQLVARLFPQASRESVRMLADATDPSGANIVTFSMCVQGLSREMLRSTLKA